MAVVAGTGTEKFDLGETPPRRIAAHSEDVQPHHHVVHERQTGVAADDDASGIDAEQFAEVAFRLGQPLQHAVVAGVGTVLGADVAERRIEHRATGIQLIGTGFAARHIEFQPALPETPVSGVEPFLQGDKFLTIHLTDAHIHCRRQILN